MIVLLALAAPAASAEPAEEQSRAARVGTQVGLVTASVVASAVYLPVKVAYAVVGLPVAGLTWLATLGDDEAADRLFVASTRGDYLITPSHPRDPGSIQFAGRRAVGSPGRVYAASGGLPDVSAPPPDPSKVVCRDIHSFRQVNFALDSAEISGPAAGRLDYVAAALRKCSQQRLRIEGHTDSTGTAPHNAALSQRRAQAVKLFLVDRGVAESRLHSEGFGEASPAASNETRNGRAENRRAELPLD